MAHDYTGDPTGITPATAITIHEPDDGDPDNVASVNPTVFERLANWVKFLFTQAALFLNANGTSNYVNAAAIAFSQGSAASTVKGTVTGGGSAGSGLEGVAAGTGAGVKGSHVGAGNAGSFDTTGGTGDALKAAAGDAIGGVFTNNSATPSNAAVVAHNSGDGPGMRGQSDLAGHLGAAFDVVDGGLKFTGGVSPVSTAALHNFLSPGLLVKAWALLHTSGGAAVTVLAGQNIAGASLVDTGGGAGEGIEVDWAQPFASDNVAMLFFPNYAQSQPFLEQIFSGAPGLPLWRNGVAFRVRNSATGTVMPATGTAFYVVVVALGVQ